MRKQPIKFCLGLCAVLALLANTAYALDFRSAASHGVILFDAPNNAAHKVFVLSRGTPLEIMVDQGDWMRVRDQGGSLAWIHKQDLSSQRTVQVIKPASIYREADSKSPVLFRASAGLLLNLLENTKTGWIKIKHHDGDIGYIRIEEVWGL
ncbi:MAG: SH3 domain-containing protein [Formivibrio sp.]|nr:SH3 domain-containing protein [Formivibrio sp.]